MKRATDDAELGSPLIGPAAPSPSRPAIVPAKLRPAPAGGLRRLRLEELLETGLWERRLAMVVAPAGSGKTTLLAQFAAALGAPAAWYRADESDASADTLLAYLEASVAGVLPRIHRGWGSVEDAVTAIEGWPEARLLLVVDDLHLLLGTPAAAAFEQLLAYRPPTLAILAASRTAPSFRLLSRLRLAGELLELGAEDLRFRSWEVERLFSEHYGQPLPPEEAVQLARRTEGWAAGLQMFHLGTTTKTPSERRQTLAALGVRTRLVREYLARNVLDDLPAHLRAFLVATCVLSRLSGPLCDQLLATTQSAANLAELERRQVFTAALESGDYRYHESLRAHLEGVLREELGDDEARRRHRRAAALLEASGWTTDALQAYCRAEDWAAVARLLGQQGESLAGIAGDWIALLPPSLSAHDPWVLLATARRLRACGRWTEAMATYRAAESGFGSQAGSQAGLDSAAEERLALGCWFEAAGPAAGWCGVVRAAVGASPLAAAARGTHLSGARGRLASGLACLVAGDVRDAVTHLAAAAQGTDASPELAAGALLAGAAATALAGSSGAKAQAEAASRRAEDLGLPWLARMGQAVLALTDRPDGRSEAAAVRLHCLGQGDLWGACIAGLLEGLGELRAGGTRPGALAECAAGFRRLGAHALEAWCLCILAAVLTLPGDPGARSVAEQAERTARRVGLRGPWAVAYLMLARCGGVTVPADELQRWAAGLAEDCGLELLALLAPDPSPAAAEPASPLLLVRCFGGFRIVAGGTQADLGTVKPRARKLLHLLVLHTERPVHREVLIEALWPGVDLEVGARNLHVAVSTLRQFLHGSPCAGALRIAREGEDYRLQPSEGCVVDVAELAALTEQGRRCLAAGDRSGAIASFRGVLALQHGDLLPEDGPDDWVVSAREGFRATFVDAARTLARLLLEEGEATEAARCCEVGLSADPNRDELWRTLRHAHESAGNHAAARAAQRRYERVLAELGIG